MSDKEIIERAKNAGKRTFFGELVHSPISKGVNSAYEIGFIEGMVEYRNSLKKQHVSEDVVEFVPKWVEENSDDGGFFNAADLVNAYAKLQKEKLINKACEWWAKHDSYAKPTNVLVDSFKESMLKTI